MRRTILALAISGLCLGSAAQAAPIQFYTALSGPNEAPPNASPGTGRAWVTYDLTAMTMRVEIIFKDLLGTTTASHIHAATDFAGTGTAGVATQTPSFVGFPLGVTSGSYARDFDLSLASTYRATFLSTFGGNTTAAAEFLVNSTVAGKAYLNVHTNTFPGGEIRGFLEPVPEPGTMVLLGSGLVGLVARRRRRR